MAGLCSTKNVVEDIEIDDEGDKGTNGRPRIRELEIVPPNYE